MIKIVGEMCSIDTDPSELAPPPVAASVLVNSAPEGAVAPIPGGLIVVAIAPDNAENAEIDTGGVTVPAVTARTPSLKAIA
jgi:hypothetical protein